MRLCAGRAQPGILPARVEEGAGGGGGGRPLQLAGDFFLFSLFFFVKIGNCMCFLKISIYFWSDNLVAFFMKKKCCFPLDFCNNIE